jgi:hypothetical protein
LGGYRKEPAYAAHNGMELCAEDRQPSAGTASAFRMRRYCGACGRRRIRYKSKRTDLPKAVEACHAKRAKACRAYSREISPPSFTVPGSCSPNARPVCRGYVDCSSSSICAGCRRMLMPSRQLHTEHRQPGRTGSPSLPPAQPVSPQPAPAGEDAHQQRCAAHQRHMGTAGPIKSTP